MNDPRTMSIAEIYRHLHAACQCSARRADQLAELFHRSAKYLIDKIEREHWRWRDNYLREHAGCAFGAQFTNTMSPYINELVFRRYPDVAKYRHGNEDQGAMF